MISTLNAVTNIKRTDLIHSMDANVCTMSQTGSCLASVYFAPPFINLACKSVVEPGTTSIPPRGGLTDAIVPVRRTARVRTIVRVIVGKSGV